MKKAFTLAEVLITLVIIGVIAALTVPTLINKTNDLELKTAFKKAYSVASQAWLMAVTDNPGNFTGKGGWSCTWADSTSGDYNVSDGRADALKSKMKVTKSCIDEAGCWPEVYETDAMLGENVTGTYSPSAFAWVNADGMCWAVPWKGLDESTLIVDVNCNKGPNKIGKDIFSFLLGKDGVVYFSIDDNTQSGKPVSSGNVCPRASDPLTINGRSVSFRDLLTN